MSDHDRKDEYEPRVRLREFRNISTQLIKPNSKIEEINAVKR